MCKKVDNSCRDEKLSCEGCIHNKKRKIIEIYLTEDKENDEFFIEVENVDDTETSNAIMKRLLQCLLER